MRGYLDAARQSGSLLDLHEAKRDLAKAEKRLGFAAQRDELAATRPEGCWCLGLGGRGVRFIPIGDGEAVQTFEQWCNCPEAQVIFEQAELARDQAKKYRRETLKKAAWVKTGVPQRFLGFRLDTSPVVSRMPNLANMLTRPDWGEDADNDAYDALVENWERSWFLFGPYGTGKTGLAISYAWQFFDLEYDCGEEGAVLFRTMPNLLSELRATYRGDGPSEDDVLGSYTRVRLLVLDDMGAEHVKDKDWLADRLYQIVGNRHADNRTTTVFTSNLNLEQLAEKLGERVTWRIIEMCGADHIIRVDGPNLRDR